MIRKQFIYLSLLALFVFVTTASFADLAAINIKKAQLYIDNGLKAEQIGNDDEALTLYEQAAELTPNNPVPSIYIAKLFTKVGMYTQAQRRLNEIPKKNLSKSQRAELQYLGTIIHISKGSLQKAATSALEATKLNPNNTELSIIYASLNYLLGFSNNSIEILNKHTKFSSRVSSRALLTSFWLDMQLGEISRAFNTAKLLAKEVKKNRKLNNSITSRFIQSPALYFLAFLPLTINPILGFVYFFILFSTLGIVVNSLSTNRRIKTIFLFSGFCSILFITTQQFIFKSTLVEVLKPGFSIHNNIWIAPKLLVALHFMSIAMFALLPLFKLLPQNQRPNNRELYGVWFFNLFFMIFICSFQGRIEMFPRFCLMTFGAFFSILASVTIPMGRYVIFKLTNMLGLRSISGALNTELDASAPVSFTEAKIFQANSHNLIIKEEFLEVIIQGKKLLHQHSYTALPVLWQYLILVMILTEDYESANSNINDYLKAFDNTSHYEKGLLYQAYLKSNLGDFADALKIIKSLPNSKIKGFTKDETAICLLVLGRCGCHYKELVQAHVDLNKAISFSKIPFLKGEALFEIACLDYKMNAKVAMKNWSDQAKKLKGGNYVQAYKKTIISMTEAFNQNLDKAIKTSEEAIALVEKNSDILGWYGHLLLKANRTSDAEAVLSKMTSNSFASSKLIAELTQK